MPYCYCRILVVTFAFIRKGSMSPSASALRLLVFKPLPLLLASTRICFDGLTYISLCNFLCLNMNDVISKLWAMWKIVNICFCVLYLCRCSLIHYLLALLIFLLECINKNLMVKSISNLRLTFPFANRNVIAHEFVFRAYFLNKTTLKPYVYFFV